MKSTTLIIPIFISHRGCPHQCLFCNQHAITGRGQGAENENDTIAAVIDSWLCRSPDRHDAQVAFYGGSFTCLAQKEQAKLLAQVQPYLADGRVKSIRLSTRPDCLDTSTCRLLFEAGVKTVELGVQSLDDGVLRRSQRGHGSDESRQAIRLLHEHGLEVGVQLLPGLPGETTASFLRGVQEIVTIEPDMVRLYPALVVEGSALADLYRKGEYAPLSLNKAITLVRRAKEIFAAGGIPVIRMGLQPSEALARELVAGPYHPAFGELVASRCWFRQIRTQLGNCQAGQHLQVHISNRDISAVVGKKRMNIQRLENLGYRGNFSIIPDTLRERGSVKYVVC